MSRECTGADACKGGSSAFWGRLLSAGSRLHPTAAPCTGSAGGRGPRVTTRAPDRQPRPPRSLCCATEDEEGRMTRCDSRAPGGLLPTRRADRAAATPRGAYVTTPTSPLYSTALRHHFTSPPYVTASAAPLYVTALRPRIYGAALRRHFTSPRLSTLDHSGSRARWGTRVPSEQSAANGLRTPPSPTFLRSRLTLRQAQLKPFRVSDSSGEPQARPGDPRHTLQPRVPDVCIFNKLQV